MNVIEQRRIRLIFALLGNLFGAGAGIVNGVINRKAQQKENERDRQFNAEEAQKQRDWQERMYHENESPQAQVQQQLQAGLNPFANGASSQSVGSGSTASAGSSSLPSAPPISDFIAGIPQAMLGIKQTKSEIANTEADTQVKLSQARTEWFNSIIAETDALNRQAIIDAEIAGLQETTGLTRAQRKENEIRVKMLEEFRDNGGNTFQAEQDKLDLDMAISTMRAEFDKRLFHLDYQERSQALKEFLDTSEMRVSLFNAQRAVVKLGIDEATRKDELQQLHHQYEMHIANEILNNLEDGNSSIDAVVLKYLTSDPSSTLNALTAVSNILKNSRVGKK